MDHAFWLQRWRENKIAFHEGAVNALLSRSFDRLALARGDRVFVPLCGKTADLAWLAAQGCRVVGIELSRSAVEAVFADMGVAPEITEMGKLILFRAEGVEVFVGDIFDLSVEALGPVDAVYDRAALVALPEAMRVSYAVHLAAITNTARQLLITFDYDQAHMDGPPFSVDGDEVAALYGRHYRPQVVATTPITGSLADRCSGTENAWLLEPLGAGG
ncbi:MAG: thiopurine S-methyltransferase [Pseudomonadota bacterium]